MRSLGRQSETRIKFIAASEANAIFTDGNSNESDFEIGDHIVIEKSEGNDGAYSVLGRGRTAMYNVYLTLDPAPPRNWEGGVKLIHSQPERTIPAKRGTPLGDCCDTCRFYQAPPDRTERERLEIEKTGRDPDVGWCRFFPTYTQRKPVDWCGQFGQHPQPQPRKIDAL